MPELVVSFFPSAAVGEAQSSVSVAEDLQTYSESEWKGNTTKSLLIRKVSLLLSHFTVSVSFLKGIAHTCFFFRDTKQ